MRRPTNAELERQLRESQIENTKLLQGMNDAIDGSINWFKTVNHEGMRYRFGLSRLTSAHGGLFYIHTSKAGQSDYTAVRFIDDEYSAMQHLGGSEWHTVAADVVYQAFRMRDAKLREERDAR